MLHPGGRDRQAMGAGIDQRGRDIGLGPRPDDAGDGGAIEAAGVVDRAAALRPVRRGDRRRVRLLAQSFGPVGSAASGIA
jgi:hypothetical protein